MQSPEPERTPPFMLSSSAAYTESIALFGPSISYPVTLAKVQGNSANSEVFLLLVDIFLSIGNLHLVIATQPRVIQFRGKLPSQKLDSQQAKTEQGKVVIIGEVCSILADLVIPDFSYYSPICTATFPP
ncbi:hypothetical protein E5288_WYG009236 [Bos mutus]|uniref:Uncharacterized protein n=1 Tax=Bos mutus TaxID=72004 RepID=A0A6B0QSR5_9CETA|nr:hypothetical protein [Bos mutus]